MKNPACPNCTNELSNIDESKMYFCETCQNDFVTGYYCDKCDSELERLNACGADNYFCNNCNELKSKRSLVSKIKPKN